MTAQGSSGEDPPAGWYPDPRDPGRARYWDGQAWTGYTGPLDPGAQQAPPASVPVATPPAAQPVKPPRRLGGIAWAAYLALGFAVLVNLAYVLVALDYADNISTQLDERSLSLDEAHDTEDAFAVVSGVYLLSVIAGAIGFLIWFYRAYSNLPGITAQSLRFGAGWSIGAWFVPILNLWRPKQIANDVWRGGDPRATGNREWNSLPVAAPVHWWWAIFLLAGFIGGIGGGLLSPDAVLSDSVVGSGVPPPADPVADSDLQQEHAAAVIVAASGAFEAIAAVLAIVFARRASRRQDEMIASASGSQADA